ncbi:MAG: TolC family protein [Sulfurovum sp.]|nr:TolC family protein [Sulfurovum sp.]
MRLLLILFFSLSTLSADTIDTLIAQAFKKHPSLDAIQQRLAQMDTRISLSQKWADPDVSLNINDIQFGDPLSRDLEPMQYQAISAKQQFPWFGKLEAKKIYALSQKKEILDSYAMAKVTLAKEIRLSAYTIKELNERIKILHKYKIVSQQNIELYTSYASTQNKSHSSSVTASLLLSQLKIREERYKAILAQQKAKLTYLLQKKVSSVVSSLDISKPKSLQYYLHRLPNNPSYIMQESKQKTAHAQQTLSDLAHTPDPYVKVGYFNRQEYADYASVNVGISLPIYGRQEDQSEISRLAILEANSAILDYNSSLKSEIERMHITLNEAYHIYNIIQNESLPQIAHMFDLSQASIQNGADLFAYTRLLEEKLALEEERIAIQATYWRTQAQLNALIGEI